MENQKYILDTHVLIWMCFEKEKLSTKIKKIIDKAENKSLIILSTSFWEIGVKIRKNAIDLPLSLQEYVLQLEKISNIIIYDPTAFDWVNASALIWEHRDPIDRLIVSIAENKNYKVLTKDLLILKKTKLAIW